MVATEPAQRPASSPACCLILLVAALVGLRQPRRRPGRTRGDAASTATTSWVGDDVRLGSEAWDLVAVPMSWSLGAAPGRGRCTPSLLGSARSAGYAVVFAAALSQRASRGRRPMPMRVPRRLRSRPRPSRRASRSTTSGSSAGLLSRPMVVAGDLADRSLTSADHRRAARRRRARLRLPRQRSVFTEDAPFAVSSVTPPVLLGPAAAAAAASSAS